MAKRIAVFTGKRGGFGAMLGIVQRIQADYDMELCVVASDMHLSAVFGNTINEVRERVAIDAVVDLGSYGSKPLDRTQALGRCIQHLAPELQRLRPDILLLLGDRGETLAAAMCAVEMGVVVAHIQAGDISGGLDDIHRHAITKLAHLHFSQNENQRQRVIKLGEAPERVWTTGAPYVDNILGSHYVPTEKALAVLGLPPDEDFIIVLQHSDTYHPDDAYPHMKATLDAMRCRPERKIVVYPCSDPGYQGVIDAIVEVDGEPGFRVFRSIEAMTFLGLMRGARALVGNSSGGIIEAPYFHLPFVLIGHRQDGREMASNVVRVPEPTPERILGALEATEEDSFVQTMAANDRPFGDGTACERIYEVLKEAEIGSGLFRKRITY